MHDSSPPAPAIEVEDLYKSYGAVRALNGASLNVIRGEVFGLVGPNGAGKSTLIKAICGVLKPDAGTVSVFGMDAGRDRHAIRRRLGYMPQEPALYDDLSPRENLVFFGRGYGTTDLDRRIRESLELVGLRDRQGDALHTFSGGMRQRASLACALMREPKLLILDEPTAGVDPTLKQVFWRHFHKLKRRGVTIFLTTNMMDEALRCDRVAVIRGGRILVTEPPETIRARGRTRVTLELAGGGAREEEVSGYEEQLPRLLEGYGLSGDVKRISINQPSFEEVVLSMITESRGKPAETGKAPAGGRNGDPEH